MKRRNKANLRDLADSIDKDLYCTRHETGYQIWLDLSDRNEWYPLSPNTLTAKEAEMFLRGMTIAMKNGLEVYKNSIGFDR